ncbi:MAG: hypothetical protein EOM73_03220 [Bacteroidia bacterium]|nr:hypothetical protein [Bacteroidia bacterium]
MVNNQIKGACFSRPLLIFSLMLLTSTINGQNISKYYTSSLQGNGVLYFISPQIEFSNNIINAKFIYDITYLTTNDTATINFSYYDKNEKTIDSVVFVSDNQRYSARVKKLFIETKKLKWHYRYSFNFSFTDLNIFFNQTDNPKIILYTQQGAVELSVKTKTWKKKSVLIKKILTLIKYNQ